MATANQPALERAGVGPRMAASAIDGLIVAIVWAGAVFSIPDIGRFAFSGAGPLISLLLAIVYIAFMQARTGSTIGKNLTGIRVVRVSSPYQRGFPLHAALLREMVKFLNYIFLFGFMALAAVSIQTPSTSWSVPIQIAQLFSIFWWIWLAGAITSQNDPLHDAAAGTTVVMVK